MASSVKTIVVVDYNTSTSTKSDGATTGVQLSEPTYSSNEPIHQTRTPPAPQDTLLILEMVYSRQLGASHCILTTGNIADTEWRIEVCNASCIASRDEISFSDFERIYTNEAMAENSERTEINFVDTVDDNGFPFMELYMNAGLTTGDEKTSLSKAEKDRLRERPEFELPDSSDENGSNPDD
ncbi:uncharacterized protein PAC_10307 [Phialocephala subalpina]|uniref:Uncharacterized protein n=1 Tax=Phialocephala subalpina TaxID=576137 RepID=A0A1L7X5X5_9HELO|nr:uncharacterized protein PAC_10307 [Phialocephala subalpina]